MMKLMGQWLIRLLAVALLMGAVPAAARRVAIVVANAAYVHVPALANPSNDARAVVAAFGPAGLGFDTVELISNTDLRALRRLPIRVRQLGRGADTLVVYLAGHGMRDEARRNYFLPVDADIKSAADIEAEGLDVEAIVQEVKAAAPGVGLIVLDACRNNPFYDRLPGRSIDRGLTRRGSDGLDGVLIAYAADGGQIADDGRAGTLSPFAAAFVKRVRQPGARVLDLLDEVGDEVRAATGGRQTPTRDGNLRTSAVLVPGAAPMIATQVVARPDLERELWDLCKTATTPAACRTYLQRHSTGTYADLAKLRVDELAPPPVATYVVPAEDPTIITARRALAGITRKMWISSGARALMTAYVQAGGTVAGLNAMAAATDANAMALLGLSHAHGAGGVVENAPLAVRWLTAAANAGQSAAQFDLAFSHASGRLGLAVNEQEAARLYKPAADQGDYYAQNNLGILYENGAGVPLNKAEAARLYKLAADQGYANAQKNLGVLYENGAGVPQNYPEAARLYKLAADQGLADAQNNLGVLNDRGAGMPRNKTEAARLYKLAADQGNSFARNNLGVLNQRGEGVPINKAEAARLYKLAADQGYANAQFNLGTLHDFGEGVPMNKAEAARLYKLAADQGYANAQDNLGFLYQRGEGVPINKNEAARLYKLAVDQGHANAQNNLATLYENGEGGLRQDRSLAIELYRKAAAAGNQYAVTNLKRLGVTP